MTTSVAEAALTPTQQRRSANRQRRRRRPCKTLLQVLLGVALVVFVAVVFFVEKAHRYYNHSQLSMLTDFYVTDIAPPLGPKISQEDVQVNNIDNGPIVPLRDDPTKIHAQRCVQAGYGGIYFKHFRKTGGSSLYHSFREHQCLQRNIPVFGSEFPFFNTNTFHVLNSTIFVTTIRHPIERILSMYWFEGRWPRTCHKACENNKTKDDTTKVAELEEWIEAIHDQTNQTELGYVRHSGCGQWVSVENYYTRMLLGIDRARGPAGARATLHQRGFRNVTLDARHLQRAKQILASFDVILIQEEMSTPSNKTRMFHEVTGYGDNNNIPPDRIGVERMGVERAKYFVPPRNSTLDRLRQWNTLDIELYDYAVQLSNDNYEKWERWRNEMGNNTAFDAKAVCQKPAAQLPKDIADIAVGGDFCAGGRWSGSKWEGFWYFPSCVFHSKESLTK